jgi:hypothetical protein
MSGFICEVNSHKNLSVKSEIIIQTHVKDEL